MSTTILCVDDEENILASLKRLLRKESYRLLTASSGAEGLAILEKETAQLVISDQRMPSMSGTEFLQKVKELYPDTVRVVLSGYADVTVILDSINKGEIYRFLTKPWNDEELKIHIRQCLAHYDLVRQNKDMMKQLEFRNKELGLTNTNLETTIEERTHTLRLSQRILDALPTPMIGVGEEGTVAFVNGAVPREFPELATWTMGCEMKEIFPPELLKAVSECFSGKAGNPVVIHPKGRPIRFHLTPLEEGPKVTGCILTLEK